MTDRVPKKTHVSIEGTKYIFTVPGEVSLNNLAWGFDDSGHNDTCGVKLLQIDNGYVKKTFKCKANIGLYCKNKNCNSQLCNYSHEKGLNFCKHHSIGMIGNKLVEATSGYEYKKKSIYKPKQT